jgi:hypothetical protein
MFQEQLPGVQDQIHRSNRLPDCFRSNLHRPVLLGWTAVDGAEDEAVEPVAEDEALVLDDMMMVLVEDLPEIQVVVVLLLGLDREPDVDV